MTHSAKDIQVKPISGRDAAAMVKQYHYSGKPVQNSQLHLGVFLDGKCEGVMSFGPSLDKRKTMGLVSGTGWNGFIELNRMAFSDRLPRNSESRALAVAFRMIKKNYPHIEWIISFADGTQCGDGTIYRASGFLLTGIKKNTSIWEIEGQKFTDVGYRTGKAAKNLVNRTSATKGKAACEKGGGATMRDVIAAGGRPLAGFQLRYVYFLNPKAQARLTVPVLPFSAIAERGAGMYKGEKVTRVKQSDDATGVHPVEGGSIPTHSLQNSGGTNDRAAAAPA